MDRPSHHSIILPGNGAGNGAPSEQLEQRASRTETGSKEDTAAASSTCISSSTFSCDEDSTLHPHVADGLGGGSHAKSFAGEKKKPSQEQKRLTREGPACVRLWAA